mgnify:CR=1 FL=1|tara:strand:+ start:1063 stop:1188 length:126 start_codon:yes stop_codon:yes gene_type:complete
MKYLLNLNFKEQMEIQIEQLNCEGIPAVHVRDEVIALIKAA